MDSSVFKDKKKVPDDDDLAEALGSSCGLWRSLHDYVHLKNPAAFDEWSYAGEKYGWSFRIKDKKRAFVYLLPRDRYFKAAFVFGQKATDKIMASPVADAIKTELAAARVYGEGRGIRLDVRGGAGLDDIKALIDIKLAN
jgi:hypothetical protein